MAEEIDYNKLATEDPNYTEQANLYDTQQTQDTVALNQQKTGISNSYAQSRQDAINSYQDALDQINYGMRQVGIQTRAGSASRGLYDASGQLSGIGQNVASTAIEPLVRQTRVAGERQAQQMANLNTNEQQALAGVDTAIAGLGLKTSQQKLDLKNSIIKALQDAKAANDKTAADAAKAAQDQANKDRDYQFDIDKENADRAEKDRNYNLDVMKAEANIPGTRGNQLKVRAEEEQKGRTYIDDPKKLAAIAKSGKHTIRVGKDMFLLSAKEEADLANINSAIWKRSQPTKDSGEGDGDPSDAGEWIQFYLDWNENNPDTPFDMSVIPSKDRANFVKEFNKLMGQTSVPATEPLPLYDRKTGQPIDQSSVKKGLENELLGVNQKLNGMSVLNVNYAPLKKKQKELQDKIFAGQTISQNK
jgi:hypothetical protein